MQAHDTPLAAGLRLIQPVQRPARLLLMVENCIDRLGPMIDAAEAFLASWGVDPADRQQALILLDEVASNVAKYAWPEGEVHAFEVGLAVEHAGPRLQLAIEIADDGAAFDPTTAGQPEINAALEAREPGGLGLFMVGEISDEMIYRRADGRNHLRLVKLLSPLDTPQGR